MLLTGLRWGEAAGILWDDVSWVGDRVNIRRAVVRGFDDIDEPTKTGAKWVIRMTEPLHRLLQVQKARTYIGRLDGRVFPGLRGGVMSYHEWRKRGWLEAIRRAKVSPREGDAQKALRRSFITSALICRRNPKQISEAVGHRTTRMVTDVYDSFLGEDAWADDAELVRLQGIYGWTVKGAPVVPSGALANRGETA
jgi:integrase